MYVFAALLLVVYAMHRPAYVAVGAQAPAQADYPWLGVRLYCRGVVSGRYGERVVANAEVEKGDGYVWRACEQADRNGAISAKRCDVRAGDIVCRLFLGFARKAEKAKRHCRRSLEGVQGYHGGDRFSLMVEFLGISLLSSLDVDYVLSMRKVAVAEGHVAGDALRACLRPVHYTHGV